MEVWKVVGFRKCDFIDSQGIHVKGYRLFLARQPERNNIVGLETHAMFISSAYVDYIPQENEMINIDYNRFGKVSKITPVEV